MMSVRGDANVVIQVQAKLLDKGLRSISLTLVGELIGAFAQVSIEDALETDLPLVADLLGLISGNSFYIRLK